MFREQTGTTPAHYVERVRVEAARAMLEVGQASHGEIARRCGFRSPEALRQVFVRQLGVSPARYRATTSATLPPGRGPRDPRPRQTRTAER